jgi:RNA polymerase sigma-70 factor (family 1)
MGAYQMHSDLELTRLLQSGDHEAYTEIYNRFKSVLYVHAYNKLRNTEEAKDVVQDLFVSLWNRRSTLQLTGELSSYLYQAVRNRVFRVIERQGLASNHLQSIHQFVISGNNVTDYLVREHMLRAMIEREIDALPEKMKEIFILSRKMNLSHKEIADELEISDATVKKQVNNALKILRSKLGRSFVLMI